MEMLNSTEWMKRGNCRDMPPDLFFPRYEAEEEIALRACGGCAVRETCLAYAIEHRIDHGVWGGATEEQRRQLRRVARQSTSEVA